MGAARAAAPCAALSDLVPAGSDLPEGWRLLDAAAGADVPSGQALTLLLGGLRRNGVPVIEERRFGVSTPQGPFAVAYALLAPGVSTADALRSAVPGSGVAARQFGRILFLATTPDRNALRTMSDRLSERLASHLREAAQAADEVRDSDRFLECAGEFVAAFPDHGPAHFMMAEYLLFKAASPQPEQALPHIEKALSPNGRPPLSAVDRWRSLYDRGVAESLLGRLDASIRTLKGAEDSAPDDGRRADAQYQLAASFALSNLAAESVAALRRSIVSSQAAGRPSPAAAAAGDVAFSSLRSDPAFRQLVGAPPSSP